MAIARPSSTLVNFLREIGIVAPSRIAQPARCRGGQIAPRALQMCLGRSISPWTWPHHAGRAQCMYICMYMCGAEAGHRGSFIHIRHKKHHNYVYGRAHARRLPVTHAYGSYLRTFSLAPSPTSRRQHRGYLEDRDRHKWQLQGWVT